MYLAYIATRRVEIGTNPQVMGTAAMRFTLAVMRGCTKPPLVENLHAAGAAEIARPACDLRFCRFNGCGTQLTALMSGRILLQE